MRVRNDGQDNQESISSDLKDIERQIGKTIIITSIIVIINSKRYLL